MKLYNAMVFKKAKKNILFLGGVTGNYLVFLPMFRVFRSRFPKLVGADTDVCIDGYPRSGNTYFVSAFLGWNQSLTVAHHTHLAGSVKYALKRNIPTAVLLRRPEDAVSSVLVWDGLLSITIALASYIHFYQTLWKYRGKFLVLPFEDVTKRPDICVQNINQRFGRQFSSMAFSTELDEEIRARLEKADLQYNRKGVNASLPNPDKSQLKKRYAKRVLSSRLYPYAEKLFQKYSDL